MYLDPSQDYFCCLSSCLLGIPNLLDHFLCNWVAVLIHQDIVDQDCDCDSNMRWDVAKYRHFVREISVCCQAFPTFSVKATRACFLKKKEHGFWTHQHHARRTMLWHTPLEHRLLPINGRIQPLAHYQTIHPLSTIIYHYFCYLYVAMNLLPIYQRKIRRKIHAFFTQPAWKWGVFPSDAATQRSVSQTRRPEALTTLMAWMGHGPKVRKSARNSWKVNILYYILLCVYVYHIYIMYIHVCISFNVI